MAKILSPEIKILKALSFRCAHTVKFFAETLVQANLNTEITRATVAENTESSTRASADVSLSNAVATGIINLNSEIARANRTQF